MHASAPAQKEVSHSGIDKIGLYFMPLPNYRDDQMIDDCLVNSSLHSSTHHGNRCSVAAGRRRENVIFRCLYALTTFFFSIKPLAPLMATML